MATIEFADVTKEYPGASQLAVDHVSFTVREGAICMLLGTSGSGKTTLLRMVNRLIDPTSGQIRIDGKPTVETDAVKLRRGIGYVIQQVGLFPHLTIAENVRLVPSILGQPASMTTKRVDDLLELVGLNPAEYRKRYPRQLSGGQQQRVGLARALAADPAVMLLDEPFGALDAITRGRMQDELLRIQNGVSKTMIFVTHDVAEAFKLGDQIAVLSEGKLIQFGAPGELLMAPANDFVRRLVGADDILRQFEYLSVVVAMEPVDAQSAQTRARVSSKATLLTALLKLIETGETTGIVEDDGNMLGAYTLASMYSALKRADAEAVARQTANVSDERAPSAR